MDDIQEALDNIAKEEGVTADTTTEAVKEAVPTEPTPEPEPAPETAPEPAEEEILPEAASAEVEKATEEYTPNYKFTVKDKELEFDEWARPLVKDAESEEKFRDVMQKIHGIDFVKEERDTYKASAEEFQSKFETQTNSINLLSDFLNNRDYASFFKSLNIPTKDILQFALQTASYDSWTPEQQRAYDDQWDARRQAQAYQQQNAATQSQLENLQQQMVVNEFNAEMARPEIASFQKAFDERNGEGAFKAEVAQRGRYYEQNGETNVTVGKLVQELVGRFGGFGTNPQTVATQNATTPVNNVQAPKEVPVIPNTGGGGGQSPAQKSITSLADLDAAYKEALAKTR